MREIEEVISDWSPSCLSCDILLNMWLVPLVWLHYEIITFLTDVCAKLIVVCIRKIIACCLTLNMSMYIFTSLSRIPVVYFLRGTIVLKRIAVLKKKKTSFVLTFDMPLKRSCYRNIMKGVLLFCTVTVLHTFWYPQDTWTVCLLIFKNKYYKGKWREGSRLFYWTQSHNLAPQLAWKKGNNCLWYWHFLLQSFEMVSVPLFVIRLYRQNDSIR